MVDTDNLRMPLTSADLLGERFEALREIFPEVFTEGRIDFDRLRLALGEQLADGPERYGLTWPGKAEAIRAIQTPSTGTLVPMPKESVNFDAAENLIIEGDNLEVLKLLQKSYHSKIKMIYIDPPYNTGNDFIYPDNFREGLDEYLRYSGQLAENGARRSTSTEAGGRYHSAWLSMMYPRLFLARNLLLRDGVIFVSIDDHEVHNLRMLLDEIFGSENFIASVVWQKVYAPKNTARHFSEDHDHILVYARDADVWAPALLPRTEEANARYENTDNDPRGPWKPSDLTARNYYSQGQYEVTSPSGRKFRSGVGRYWRSSHEKFLELERDNRIWWGPRGDSMPAQKRFLTEVKQGIVPQTLWTYREVGHTQDAKKELLKYVHYVNTENVLNTVKPVRLIQRMLQISTSARSYDIILDFFAGSATTGHAVLKQNVEDGGNRRFICVQIPELLPIEEPGLNTLADISRARLRSVHDELQISSGGDSGFRSFKLTASNFKVWNGAMTSADPDDLARQLELYVDHLLPDRSRQDVLYELILKAGLPLTVRIEPVEVGGGTAFLVDGDALLICLERRLTKAMLDAIIGLKPVMVVCLDSGFQGADQLKTNTVLEMMSHDVEFRTV